MPITGRSVGYLFTWRTKVELGIDPEDGSLEETRLRDNRLPRSEVFFDLLLSSGESLASVHENIMSALD
jgi:hypothetical protein